MQVLIEAPFTVNDAQEENIKSQLNDLLTYNDRMTRAQVYFKLDDGVKPNVVLAEIQLHVPGPVVFASDTAEDFMDAFTGAYNKAKRQLRDSKDIRQDHQVNI